MAKEIKIAEGKLPPQALELEESVIGAILLDKEAIGLVVDIITPESFYIPNNALIFKACINLFSKGEPIDLLTVSQELSEMGELEQVGGRFAITQFTSRMTSGANVEYHARIVQQKAVARKLINITSRINSLAYDDTSDSMELISDLEKEINEITKNQFKTEAKPYKDLYNDAIKNIDNAKQRGGKPVGLASGFHDLDKVTGGFKGGNLICIAARPGMGKTALMLAFADRMAKDGNPGAIFSLEMNVQQLTNRLISLQTEIPGSFLRDQTLNSIAFEQLMIGYAKFSNLPIYIDDTSGITPFELRAKARRMKKKFGIKWIMIDYVQLMESGLKGHVMREQEISYISRSLKALAKELDIPIIELAQLSRDVEKRGKSMKPVLSDLRESGSIEQDADIVMFPFRPSYYKIFEDENKRYLPETYAEISILKHRDGTTGDIEVKFEKTFARYSNVNESYQITMPEVQVIPRESSQSIKEAQTDDLPF